MTNFLPAAPGQVQQLKMAEQLSAQYQLAISGTREILIFGAMMMQLGINLSSQTDGYGGISSKGEGLKGWLAEFCPDINYNTAYGFYRLAVGLAQTLSLPASISLYKVLSAPEKTLGKRERQWTQKIRDAIEGRSKRQLEFDFGIRFERKQQAPTGGYREGAGRKPYSIEREQMQIEDFFSDDFFNSLVSACIEKRWHLRIPPNKQTALATICEHILTDLQTEWQPT